MFIPSMLTNLTRKTVDAMDNIDLNKPLFQCTLGEFKAVIVEAFRDKELEDIAAKAPKRYVYGLSGLMELLGCSISTAERIKQSGVIDEAISQTSDIIVTDAELALDLLRVSHKYRKYSKPKQTE